METAINLAVFCDYENLAIGARDAKFKDFEIGLALERLLDKGKIVYKKAYADWENFRPARKELHEHAFELVEIPHVSYSGKNSADIRLVVDALDLCYTKTHVDTFAILSGDSDFSPLVSKLRENNKQVIGVGVKNSSSNLLIDNCDEFIYYDDLVRKKGRRSSQANKTTKKSVSKKSTATAAAPGNDKKEEAIDLVMGTIEALIDEKEGTLWGPTVRRAIKRKRPNFSESYYGFRSFNDLLRQAEKKGLLQIQQDKSTGNYAILSTKDNGSDNS